MEKPSSNQSKNDCSSSHLGSQLQAIPTKVSPDNSNPQARQSKAVGRQKRDRREISLLRIGKLYLIKGAKVGKDRWFELFLLAVVGLSAVIQLVITIINNQGTSQQTQQIIDSARISAYAAKQNVDASQNFADSARGIKQGVSDAVGRLQAQASITEFARETSQDASRRALDASIRNARNSDRAWIAMDNVTGTPEESKVFKVTIALLNTGHSPARNVTVNQWYEPILKPQVIKTFRNDGIAHYFGLIQPNGRPTFLVDASKGSKMLKTDLDVLSLYTIYVYGVITYDDVFGLHHWTTFCTFFVPGEPTYGVCEQHNDTGDGKAPKQ